MSQWDAIGIGLVVRDISVLMEGYPEPDEKRRAEAIYESGGGPVPTALVTMARLGRRTAIAAPVGNDAVGRFVLDGLTAENIDTAAVSAREDFATPTSVILVENGRRTILEPPHGVGLPLSWQDVEGLPFAEAASLLIDARACEVQLRAAARARGHGGLVVLDCGHPREGVEELLRHTDIAIFSHTYPETLYRGVYDRKGFLTDMRDRLPPDGPAVAGLTLGADGCAVLSREDDFLEIPGHAIEAVDTTGAGDVFHGAFVHAFLETGSCADSARFANVAAASKCRGMTGRAPIPPEGELWRLARA